MHDAWLRRGAPRGPRTWAEQKRRFRALRVPGEVVETVQPWAGSPDRLEPLLRLLRDMVVSNAVHRARTNRARWAAGTARDPHHTLTPEQPGALSPLVDIVDRVIADLKRLLTWEFTPPIELHELDAKLTPTGRVVRLSRLDESIRDAFKRARRTLLGGRATLQAATQRHRGRKATLVQPFRLSVVAARAEPARRRELERLLRDELLQFHPDRKTRPRAARAEAARVAHVILSAIL